MKAVTDFENSVSEFFGAPYAVATDSCTHAIEICLRCVSPRAVYIPNHTYLSVPMTCIKLGIEFLWQNVEWKDYYHIGNTDIIDAAVYWKENSYIPNTFMCLSFQHKKHLSLGRGGMILTDNKIAAEQFKKLSYDGRIPNVPWAEQDIDMIGYHYYMTPETAELGLEKMKQAIESKPRDWSYLDYPDLRTMSVFKNVK